jgi:predicted RNA-binding protein with PUA-like domain
MAEPAKMPEGLKRLPEEYQNTNDSIERLIKLISQSDTANKKQVSGLAQEYRTEIRKIIREQDKTQKEVAFYISELRKAGANDQEIAAYLKKNVKLKSGEEQLFAFMKNMQENLQGMAQNVKFKTDEDRVLAEKQAQTLEKYFKQQEKTKAEKWANRKLNTVKEETGATLKESLIKGLGAGFHTLLGPLRLIVDPILDLGGTKSLDLFDKIINKSNEAEAVKDEAMLSRFNDLVDTYSEEDEQKEERKKGKGKTPKAKKGKDDDFETLLKRPKESTPEKPGKEKRDTNFLEFPGIPNFLPDRESEESGIGKPDMPEIPANIPEFPAVPSFLGGGEGKPEEFSGDLAGILVHLEPTRSDLLKRGGIIGASAVFLADFLAGEFTPEKPGKEKRDTNFLGIPGGIGGLKGAIAKFLPVAVGNAVAVAIPLALAAGAVALQKRDTEDAKKYADRGEYDRTVETFLLGDRERITEETAGSELARTTGKAALAGGAVAGGIAATGFITGGGAVAAAGAATAAGAGTLGAAGAAGAAALGAVVPPVLIVAAIAAAAAAVAKGTQEAYELEYDKNAAVIQRDLQRLISDEEAPFLKRVGAGFKSEWIEFTSTLAGGIRGVTEVMDVEAERNVQQQLEILRKQAEEGNEESARLYEMMSRQSFREMTAKEKERLLRSEGLYEEYVTVVAESENSFWEKLKNGVKAVVKGAEGALNTAHENMKGGITAEWEQLQLQDMDKKLSRKEDIDRLKNSEAYQNEMGETGDPLKAMQEAFLAEQREMAQARGDMDANGMVVDMFDQIKFRLKSFADISDEAIQQSTEFDTRRLQLLAEGMSAEEADRKAMEEQRDLLNSQMELRLKQTKEYKKAFDDALKEGKSLKEAEKQALNKVKGNKEYLKSFGQSLSEGLRDMWQSTRDFFGAGWDKLKSGGAAAWEGLKNFGSDARNFITGDTGASSVPAIDDGIVYKDGKVVKIADDDNVIATKAEPLIGDSETNKAAAVPVAPVINEFTDANIISVLEQILTVLKEKEFSPTINTGGDSGMDFDRLRTAGAT